MYQLIVVTHMTVTAQNLALYVTIFDYLILLYEIFHQDTTPVP